MSNYEYNRLGRLWVLWRPEVRMTPVYKTAQLITCSVLLPGHTEEFFVLLSTLTIRWKKEMSCGKI